MTLANFLGYVGDLIAQAVIWMTPFFNWILANPIAAILILGLPLVGLGVGLLTRIFRTN